MYPLRLLVEAKCNQKKVSVPVIRNAVGVIKDISENYFTYDAGSNAEGFKYRRYNYHAAVYSANGFTKVAQQYAIAHQVFLIDYFGVSAMSPVIEAIRQIELVDFSAEEARSIGRLRHWLVASLGTFTGDDELAVPPQNSICPDRVASHGEPGRPYYS